MPLNYLKVNKENELQFFSSLTFLDPAVNGRHIAVNNQEITSTITADNIIPIITEELRHFEKSFIDALARIIKKFEAAYLYDASQPAAISQLQVFENSLSELILIFHEVISTYTYRGMILWPVQIRRKKYWRRRI
jgi:hypothetical protein